MSLGFESTIKPYFTACYRAHMLQSFDLWDAAQVETEWHDIFNQVTNGTMPATGCPEGVWDAVTKAQFLKDFQAWQTTGFPP